MFAPIWSAKQHPIYQAIEVADEEQLMRLHPEIRQIIKCNSAIAWSGRSNQHQGLDAILEESAESSLKKDEIVFAIETLVETLNEAKQLQFRGLRSKRKEELLIILQQVRDLKNASDVEETT
ncbi:hypothetical protein F8M41_007627 [Gigaspora margarita]|uniref:Uncharacterized protein n=1 Tax=Gigaspora margarita TaxID=4874 RepID=A0A8H3X616_GIGMA|nr:hypothetical protein F8M41_007627 [Gigaspora margarita]